MLKTQQLFKDLRVAIVHELLLGPGGAENVVLEFLKIFPNADLFTVMYNKNKFENADPKWKLITHKKVITSVYNFIASNWWQKLPSIISNYRNYFFLWPKVMESFDLSNYDLVISSHYLAAHGVITQEHTLHISYTYTPARYFYSHYHEYLNSPFMNKGFGKIKKFIYPGIAHKFRKWDAIASLRPDYFIGISTAVKQRIKKYYNRDAKVIYPPVDVDLIKTNKAEKQDFYVTIARLVPQKKVDIMIKAFIKLKKDLYIMGKGPEMEYLQRLSAGHKNIHLLGFVSDEQKAKLLQQAKAFVFASYEDFGIVPLEGMAAGLPVIAFNKGGTLDYVKPGETGVFFNEQTPGAIADAVLRFEKIKSWDTEKIQQFAQKFNAKRFRQEFANFVNQKLEEYRKMKTQKHHE